MPLTVESKPAQANDVPRRVHEITTTAARNGIPYAEAVTDSSGTPVMIFKLAGRTVDIKTTRIGSVVRLIAAISNRDRTERSVFIRSYDSK
jgi:hypothetical protein